MKHSHDDLTIDEIEGIFSQLPRMDAVRLSGGEPFIRQDLADIVGLAKKHLDPLAIHITSNGFLKNRIISFCKERNRRVPLHLLISIDGLKEKHNQVRGRKQAWDNAVATLEYLAPRQRELNLKLSVNQTIVDSEGIEHYGLLRNYLGVMGVRNNMVLAYDSSSTYSSDDNESVTDSQIGTFTPMGSFTTEEIVRLCDEVEQDTRHYPKLDRIAKRYYLAGIKNRLLRNTPQPNPQCVALNSHIRILPNGDVPTCQFNGSVAGNLRQESFKDVWSGRKRWALRQWVLQCPGCWAECEVLANATYTGDLVKFALPWNHATNGRTAKEPASVRPSLDY
jgi:MoaA/NifB/PqqE/SkfB family radical SAM enzyme